MEQNQTEFKIMHHHRYDLRDWIRDNFGFVETTFPEGYSDSDLRTLEKRADEILNACKTVETIDLRVNSAYVDYYNRDWKNIEDACNEGDYTVLGVSLSTLLGAIDVE